VVPEGLLNQETDLFTRTRNFAIAALAAAGAATGASPALADTAASTQSCFFANQWQSWKSPSPDVILIRVNLHDVYRLQLTGPSPELNYPDVHLISEFHGSDSVCGPLDLQLEVSDGHGFRVPIIVRSMTKLTPEEAAAIPPKFRP
jgi:hypothetical protein